jgi:hypothetical protein
MARLATVLVASFALACSPAQPGDAADSGTDGRTDAGGGGADSGTDAGGGGCHAGLSPSRIYWEGDDVTLALTRACAEGQLSVSVNGAAATTTRVDDTHYVLHAPPVRVNGEVPIEVHCGSEACVVDEPLTYDWTLEPAPRVKTSSPTGTGLSVLTRMVVVFTRPMDPATFNTSTFGIVGVPGAIEKVQGDDAVGYTTFIFVPSQTLEYSHEYTCRITADVQSKARAVPLADAPVEWTFTTRCETCNPPLTPTAAWCPASDTSGRRTLEVSGYLIGADDQPYTGTIELKASLYAAQVPTENETPWWTQTRNVAAENGDFSVVLGAGAAPPIPESLVGQSLWLQLTVNSVALLPRHTVAAVPAQCP